MTDRPPAERADLEAEVERLKAERAEIAAQHQNAIDVFREEARHERAMANEWLAQAHDARKQVATLTAERDAARTEEREYCARLANWHLNNIERLRPSANDGWQKGYIDACADIETAIRARGAK